MQIPDGRYDDTHTWQNANDRVSAQRVFEEDPLSRQKIDIALRCADPDTPQAAITANLTVPGVPPRFGYPVTELTINDMFAPNLGHVNDFAPTNFSGQVGEFSGSSTPAVPAW